MKKKKSKKKFNLRKILKGFTLVELLAVIVILAVIMIIAIPAVLSTMTTAKQKSFVEFVQKVSNRTQEQYFNDTQFGKLSLQSGNNIIIYDITKDLGITSTGNFKGVALIWNDYYSFQITLIVYDDTYLFGDIVYDKNTPANAKEISADNVRMKKEYEAQTGFTVNDDLINYEYIYSLYALNKCISTQFIIYNMTTGEKRLLPANITQADETTCELTNIEYNKMKEAFGI